MKIGGLLPSRARPKAQTAETLRASSDVELERAATDMARLRTDAAVPKRVALDVLDAAAASARGVGHATKAAAQTAAAVVVGAGETIAGAIASALQLTGRAFVSIGNAFSRFGGRETLVTRTFLEPEGSCTLSDKLLRGSAASRAAAGRAFSSALTDLAHARDHGGEAACALVRVAGDLVSAAKNAGTGVRLELAARALDAADAADAARRKKLDCAGALLQRAGRAVLAAANLVTTEGGPKTRVLQTA